MCWKKDNESVKFRGYVIYHKYIKQILHKAKKIKIKIARAKQANS